LEDNLRAAEIKLGTSDLAALDEITQPPVLYPHWFNANMLDAKHHKEALGLE